AHRGVLAGRTIVADAAADGLRRAEEARRSLELALRGSHLRQPRQAPAERRRTYDLPLDRQTLGEEDAGDSMIALRQQDDGEVIEIVGDPHTVPQRTVDRKGLLQTSGGHLRVPLMRRREPE